jgi:hypothetical protein
VVGPLPAPGNELCPCPPSCLDAVFAVILFRASAADHECECAPAHPSFPPLGTIDVSRFYRMILGRMRTPAGALVVLFLLVADVLAWQRIGPDETMLLRLLKHGRVEEWARGRYFTSGSDWHFIEAEDGQLVYLDPSDSADPLVRAVATRPERVVLLRERWKRECHGLLAPWVSSVEYVRLTECMSESSSPPARPVEELEAVLRSATRESGLDLLGDRLSQPAPRIVRTVHPLWILHDVAFVCLAGVLVSALMRAPGALRQRRDARGRTRGACPKCGYDLAGLPKVEGTVRCPECGTRWGPEPR